MAGFDDLIAASAESLIVQDLRLRAGTTWNVGWLLYDNSDVLVPFSGATAIMVIKNQAGGTTLTTFTETLTSGRQIVLGNGTVAISATPAATSPLAPSADFKGYYQLLITKSSKTLSLASGRIGIFRAL